LTCSFLKNTQISSTDYRHHNSLLIRQAQSCFLYYFSSSGPYKPQSRERKGF